MIPILFLSAKSSIDDRVRGLQSGGDDYLTKPFAFSELIARVQALIRRATSSPEATKLVAGDVTLDLVTREVTCDGRPVELQPREFSLLAFLLRHAGRPVSKTMILEHVWDYSFDPQTNVVDVVMSRLSPKSMQTMNVSRPSGASATFSVSMLERLRQSLALWLAVQYALVFALSATILLACSIVLARALEERDQAVVEQRAAVLARAYADAQLGAVVERLNGGAAQDGDAWFVRVIDPRDGPIWVKAPPDWVQTVVQRIPIPEWGVSAERAIPTVRLPQDALRDYAIASRTLSTDA